MISWCTEKNGSSKKPSLNKFTCSFLMKQYHDLLHYLLEHGVDKHDRTGVGTRSCFWYQMHIDLQAWFPLLTTKKVNFDAVAYELLWFIAGDTNIRYLVQNGVNIRNERPFQNYLTKNNLTDTYPKYTKERKNKMQEFIEQVKTDDSFAQQRGELWPVYGKQRRDFNWFDQITRLLAEIQRNPTSRRLIVSARNASQIEEMAKAWLPPCHSLFQFYVSEGKLSCQLYQRSADVFLGVPFNMASYALLTHLVAHVCDLEVGTFVHTFGDVHIYNNHFEQIHEQLKRTPKELPSLTITASHKNLFAITREDILLTNYNPDPYIKAQVAV